LLIEFYDDDYPEHSRVFERTKSKIAQNILKINPDVLDHSAQEDLVGFANSVSIDGYSVQTAKLLKGAYYIDKLRTYPGEALPIIGILKDLAIEARDNPETGILSRDFNDEFSKHSRVVKAIVNIAKAGRHPELAGYAYEALEELKTESAAHGVVTLLENHYNSNIPDIPQGKRGNIKIGSQSTPKELSARGMEALRTMGGVAVIPLYRLSFLKGVGYLDSRHKADAHPVKKVLETLLAIDTPHSLKMAAQVLLDNPEWNTNSNPSRYSTRHLEDYVMEEFVSYPSARAASALVDFGAANRNGVSEAYSGRANTALHKMTQLYLRAKNVGASAGDILGIKIAAAELSAAITSEENLQNRFIIGERNQATIGRVKDNYEGKDFIEAEAKRVKTVRTKKDVKKDAKGLVTLFEHAKRIGLLSEDDRSAEKVKAYKKYMLAKGRDLETPGRQMSALTHRKDGINPWSNIGFLTKKL
ncbi:MAG: hypothetical protein AAF244_01720, partial [Pseudomonadota bacterium]